MSWYRNLSRRDFLKTATTAAVASGAISCGGARTPCRFLTVNEARCLAALCDQLIPPARVRSAHAVPAVARKLLHAIYGMFRSGRPYDSAPVYRLPASLPTPLAQHST